MKSDYEVAEEFLDGIPTDIIPLKNRITEDSAEKDNPFPRLVLVPTEEGVEMEEGNKVFYYFELAIVDKRETHDPNENEDSSESLVECLKFTWKKMIEVFKSSKKEFFASRILSIKTRHNSKRLAGRYCIIKIQG